MTRARWTKRGRAAAIAIVAALGILLGPPSPAAADAARIQLSFPDPPDLLCGLADWPGGALHAFPRSRRAYVQELVDDIYGPIVDLYGEPEITPDVIPGTSPPRLSDKMTVTVYLVGDGSEEDAGASMYLSHKSDGWIRLLAPLIVGSLWERHTVGAGTPALGPIMAAAMACGAAADIPDHAIFISDVPSVAASRSAPDAGFDHLFTHEFIHAFHDRKDYLGWYTHSWVEEGMTEAAAELVADAAALSGGPRRSWVGGPNQGAWDNLKHYDMWNYSQNGAWQGDGLYSALANLRFYFGGISVPSDSNYVLVPAPPGDHEWTNKVVEPDLRYGAAAAVWLILTKALSDDPAHPTFLRRLNEAMARDGVLSLPDNLSDANRRMIDIIASVAGDKTIEGRPVRDWLYAQWLGRGYPGETAGLWLHVWNPEQLASLDGDGNPAAPPIEGYAFVTDAAPSMLNPFGWLVPDGLQRGELPLKDCPITVSLRSASGRPFQTTDGPRDALAAATATDDGGYWSFPRPLAELAEPGLKRGELAPGGYAVLAQAGACPHFVAFRRIGYCPLCWEEGVHAGGMFASTFAAVGSGAIGWNVTQTLRASPTNGRLLGVTTLGGDPGKVWGGGGPPWIVPGTTAAEVVLPSAKALPSTSGPGTFTASAAAPPIDLADPASYTPLTLRAGQRSPEAPGGIAGERLILKPSPYTRFLWLAVRGDYGMTLGSAGATLERGASTSTSVILRPNGVAKGPPICAVNVTVDPSTRPSDVRARLEPDPSIIALDNAAPAPSTLLLRLDVGPAAPAGKHSIRVSGVGSAGGECAGLVRDARFALRILPPKITIGVDAAWLKPGGDEPVAAPVTVTTPDGSQARTTSFDLEVRSGADLRLAAADTVEWRGRTLRFSDWATDEPRPLIRDTREIRLSPTDPVRLIARYMPAEQARLTVDAVVEGSVVGVPIPVPVRVRYAGARGMIVDAVRTTRFELTPPGGADVTVEAPVLAEAGGRAVTFVGWDLAGAPVAATQAHRVVDGSRVWTARYAAADEDAVGLSIFPSTATLSAGEDITVELRADRVRDAYGLQAELRFDPAVVRVVGGGFAIGPFLPSPIVLGNRADNAAGTAELALTLTGAHPGIDGSGVVARLRLRGIAPGRTSLSFADGLVSDSTSALVDGRLRGADVVVEALPVIVAPFPVTGHVTLAGRPDAAGATVCLAGRCTAPDAQGGFTLPDALLGQTLTVSRPGFLPSAVRLTAPLTTTGALPLPPVTLLAGDVDADGGIGAGDVVAIGGAWGARQGDPAYRAAADLDGDGTIGAGDLAALSPNLYWQAPGPWPAASPPPGANAAPWAAGEVRRGTSPPPDLARLALLDRLGPRPVPADSAGQAPTTRLSIVADRPATAPGERVEVTVRLTGGRAVTGYRLALLFDPRRLSVEDADAGPPGTQVAPGDYLPAATRLSAFGLADNTSGHIELIAATRRPGEAASGDGVVARFAVRALAPGDAPIVFEGAEVFEARDPDAVRTPVLLAPGRVLVRGRTAIWLPALNKGAPGR